MKQASHLIRLVAGIEVRPPSADARFVIEREAAERIGGHIAEDLAACVEAVTAGHLATGPALLEPGQVLAPERRSPWSKLAELARLDRPQSPGVTTLGAHRGRLPDPVLGPDPLPPSGQFLCLPLLLRLEDDVDAVTAALERELFDIGGLRPPALGELMQTTGLEPVHGQLMTLTDLMALVKMQLAGAGLDPFWPPVEHMLLESDRACAFELPAGIQARWQPDASALVFVLDFDADGRIAAPSEMLRWRAFRQQTAVLDQHRTDWRVESTTPRAVVDPAMRWIEVDAGPTTVSASAPVELEQDRELGLLGFRMVRDGRLLRCYPLRAEGIAALHQRLGDAGRAP